MSFVSCGRNFTLGIFIFVLYITDFGHTNSLRVEQGVAVPKIVGGSDVKRHKWPWQTLLLIKKKEQASGSLTLCGGTLISTKWVLTAAHCVENYEKMRIYFGVWNVTNRVEVGRKVRSAKNITQHPCYDKNDDQTLLSSYNVALVELEREIFSETAICLGLPWSRDWDQLKAGRALGGCVATGYGVTDTGDDAEVLQKVEFSTVSMKKCSGYKISQNRNVVCASDDKLTGKDTCKGDMGGPLACPTSRHGCNGYYLTAVTLAGSSTCGDKDIPGIYAGVHPNLMWIRSVMRGRDRRDNAEKKKAYSCVSHSTKTRALTDDIVFRTHDIDDF